MKYLRTIILSILVLVAIDAFFPYNPNVLIERPLLAHPSEQAGSIGIVLGAGLKTNGELTSIADERVREAVRYAQEERVRLLFSGGQTPYGIEAEKMSEEAQRLGFDGEVLLEKASTSTYENALFSDALLDEQEIESVTVITSPYHSRRAQRTFQSVMPERQVGIIYPNDSVLHGNNPLDRLKALKALIREYLANLWYDLRYRL